MRLFLPKIKDRIKSSNLISSEYQKNCKVCGNLIFELFSSGYDYEINTNINLWKFEKCLNCGHVQMNTLPHKANIDLIYPSKYYSYSISKKLNPLILLGKNLLDQIKIKYVLKKVNKDILTYMDIGCGDGRYLDTINKICNISKRKIFGVELKKNVVEKLLKKGYKAFNCSVEDLKGINKNSLSLITMFHVIEHLKDPKSVIGMLNDLLMPGGFLIIETPNIDSLDVKLFKKSFWGGYHFPRHWHLFSPSSFYNLVKDMNFNIKEISYQTGHSFWLYSFHHLIKYQFNLPHLARFFDPLKSKLFLIIFTLFDLFRSRLGFKTSSMLIILEKIN